MKDLIRASRKRNTSVTRKRKEKASVLDDYVRSFLEQLKGPKSQALEEILMSGPLQGSRKAELMAPASDDHSWAPHLSTNTSCSFAGSSFGNGIPPATPVSNVTDEFHPVPNPPAPARRHHMRSGRCQTQSSQQVWLMIVERLREEIIRARDLHRADLSSHANGSKRSKVPLQPETCRSAMSSTCSVCTSEPAQGEPMAMTVCGHFLCWACLCQWHQKDSIAPSKKECPCCKKILAKNQVTFLGERLEKTSSGGTTYRSSKMKEREQLVLAAALQATSESLAYDSHPALEMKHSDSMNGLSLTYDSIYPRESPLSGDFSSSVSHDRCSTIDSNGFLHDESILCSTDLCKDDCFSVGDTTDQTIDVSMSHAELDHTTGVAERSAISEYVDMLFQSPLDEALMESDVSQVTQLKETIKNQLVANTPIQSFWLATFLASMNMDGQQLSNATTDQLAAIIDQDVDLAPAKGTLEGESQTDRGWSTSQLSNKMSSGNQDHQQEHHHDLNEERPITQICSSETNKYWLPNCVQNMYSPEFDGYPLPNSARKLKRPRYVLDLQQSESFELSPNVYSSARKKRVPASGDGFGVADSEPRSDLDSVFDESWDWSLHGGLFNL